MGQGSIRRYLKEKNFANNVSQDERHLVQFQFNVAFKLLFIHLKASLSGVLHLLYSTIRIQS